MQPVSIPFRDYLRLQGVFVVSDKGGIQFQSLKGIIYDYKYNYPGYSKKVAEFQSLKGIIYDSEEFEPNSLNCQPRFNP